MFSATHKQGVGLAVASKDVDQIRNAFSVSEVAAQFGVKLERDGDEWIALCPFHAEKTPSFTIFPGDDGAERFHCFGCGERGDVLDFVQKIKGVGLREAISILSGEVDRPNVERKKIEPRNIYEGIEPLKPVGKIAGDEWIDLYNPKRETWGKFKPEAVYPYHDAAGNLLGYVLRRALRDGGKETPMVMRVRLPDGRECWSRFPFPKPRPLYRAHKIGNRQVILVEGEKCADALRKLTRRCVVTWAGGTYGVDHADWSALAGKDVIIWPDADGPGRETAQRIARLLAGKAERVRIMDVSDRSGGWDCADAIAEGWSQEQVESFMRERVRGPDPEPAPAPAQALTGEVLPAVRAERADRVKLSPAGIPIDFYTDPNREPYPSYIPTGSDIALCNHPMRDAILELREWVFLSFDNEFYNLKTGERIPRNAFNLAKARLVPEVLMPVPGSTDVKVKLFNAEKTLSEYLRGEVVSSTMYAPQFYKPDAPFDPFFKVDGVWYVNSFRPSTLPKADPNWRAHWAWRVIDEFFDKVYGENGMHLKKWLAHNTQLMGVKVLWAPILIGPQGGGKTTVASIGRAVLGAANVRDISQQSLSSPFSAWAEGAVIRVLEEIRVQGESRYEAMNKLKPMITNERVEMVAKGKDGREILNVTNYIAMSNHEDALPITEDERRWAVFRTTFRSREHMLAETSPEWWAKVHEAYDKYREVIRGWLLDMDISDFNPLRMPDTGGANALMIEATRSYVETDIREAIALGGEGVSEEVLATDCLNNRIKENGGRPVPTITMANILRNLGWTRLEARVKWKGVARRVYYRADLLPMAMEGATLIQHLRNRLDLAGSDNSQEPIEPLPW